MQIISKFKKIIRNFFKWVNDSSEYENTKLCQEQSTMTHGPGLNHSNLGMRFTIYNADGGKIIEVSSYNERLNQSYSKLYIITDTDNLGEELGQILTREALAR